ncbi:FAD-dependent oxidoreductase [Ruania halotolerans]|uniref:FAD-dependent oxidoreductase n=1 Tax=Ruania halotolerans TaxID=2897773 RepID=UPI001E52F486|nr:NAD(P)/FAD-dependent oxidoreductase [Ruania halotolerans]UFU06160.1 FAD-dependent monooxygenase [Ruania halotolerans]
MSFIETPPHGQLEAAAQDSLPTLIVGAGIAGTTLAQLLRQSGQHPVLIERSTGGRHPGYMLALMPMVDRAFDDLGVREAYRARSVPLDRYRVRSHTGRPIRTESMARLLARYGDYRGISRGALLDALTTDRAPVSTGTTVTHLQEDTDGVTATLRTGAEEITARFAVVIIADGIGSTTRDLVATEPPARVDTGWGGWVVWAPPDEEMDLGEELWGTDFMVATYPVAGAIGVFLGAAREHTQAGPEAFVARVRRQVRAPGARMDAALQAVLDDPDPYYWPLSDVRAARWTTGRTVLLGDAAAGFLPTAGIGAGMAMESAWMLARMLAHGTRDGGPDIPSLLSSFEVYQRPRVEAAQDNSRTLARWMFGRSRVWATVRDLAVRLASVTFALGPIRKLLDDLPDPDAAVRRSATHR